LIWNVTLPGPLTLLQVSSTSPGGFGRPSSVVVSTRAAVGMVTVRSGPAFTTGASFTPAHATSTCSTGAPVPASWDIAVRCPVPVMIRARDFRAQPLRLTISWITGERSGVCWYGPTSPSTPHGAGDHGTEATVRGRDETLKPANVKVAALSAACPWITRFVTSDCFSSAVNWM
jgi:hypothetical protein